MKTKIILITLLIILMLSGLIRADFNADRKMFHKLFTYEKDEIEKLFHESFLEQVPAANVIQILNNYQNKLGALKKVESSGNGYTLIFANGTAPAKITLNKEQKIIGLWFGKISLSKDNTQEILTEFEKLAGEVSICILKNNQETVLALNEKSPMAVGSSFKLYVLKAVHDTINGSEKSWDNVVKLNSENRSLPGGILQNWLESTPVTVKTLSTLMISISDNTATDHLIDYVGREAVENYVSERNIPFLKTREFFKLKYGADSGVQTNFVQGRVEEKRDILQDLKNIALNSIKITDTPVLINELEWFFSTEELCRIIYDLRNTDEIKINTGLVEGEKWNLAGYKGGSEPGVLQYTHVLQKGEGDDIYTISVTVNNPDEGIENNKITELTGRLITLIEKEAI